jgi:hypothetical protein
MPQILHPRQHDDLCAQTYPQKMGIDNSHAEISDPRGRFVIFFWLRIRDQQAWFRKEK